MVIMSIATERLHHCNGKPVPLHRKVSLHTSPIRSGGSVAERELGKGKGMGSVSDRGLGQVASSIKV
jgi:hypothetical protein